ncbi:MAG TPA: putative Ig domain-containing protein [Verrucomicrobiae bacterium]|nr:putative Ig domain-containing protein [Verrucomicrobiae bacterium]
MGRRRRQRGQSLVEFALVAPFVLLLLVGGSDLARAYFVGIQVADGARQAALFAADNPSASPSQIAAVAEKNTGSNGSGLAATVLDCPVANLSAAIPAAVPDPNGANGFDDQKVTVTCQLPLLTPLLPSPVVISASAVGLVQEGVLAVATTALPDGVQGSLYSAQLTASGGVGADSWTLLSGTLPPGLTLTSSGAITGTPTATGTSTVTVAVTDSSVPAAETATATFSLTVRAPLAISTPSLPGATTGTAYSTTLRATGGAVPYTWTVTTGSLPAGLALDASTGTISGTPTAKEASTFTVTVTDSTVPTAQTATATYTLSVS